MSGGRPDDTTLDRGYNVGRSSTNSDHIDLSVRDLPIDWDTSSNTLNINNHLTTKLICQRIGMQRAFDQQPLTKRIC